MNINEHRKEMSIGERKILQKIITGQASPNSNVSRDLLNRPHIAIAFEALLDKYDLSDDKLLLRLAEIVRRKSTESTSDRGIKSTNITSVDANAKDVIRLIWQAQGKFVERHEVGGVGDFKKATDEDLDKLIDSGMNYLLNRGKTIFNLNKDGSSPGSGN